ncbi:TPM domain-containing protein [Acinetobacter sp. SAAs470]|nr:MULTISPECIES: TPM domain-containing protein [unclassified Acinetobacter]WOE31076.1 TPM domain-containing protein [Acinetobacter sp. SAAs470]WOE39272.1 TPM domain-containing protein [Acinetobacter sp. SAAs474]
MRAAEAWQLGSQKHDNGLLITVAAQDRKIQILTGYGLEGVLPDIVLNRIIRDKITPYFQNRQYGQGLSEGLIEIQHILDMDPEVAAQAAQELQQRYETALLEKQNREYLRNAVGIILLLGILASFWVGNRLSSATAGVAGVVAGLVYGMGILSSLLIGIVVFFLLITSIAQTVFQLLLTMIGRGGGSGGGSRGGGSSGYRGGGGGFGGGGASGSW